MSIVVYGDQDFLAFCNEQTIYRLQTRFRQSGSKIDKHPSGRPRVTTPVEVRVIVMST